MEEVWDMPQTRTKIILMTKDGSSDPTVRNSETLALIQDEGYLSKWTNYRKHFSKAKITFCGFINKILAA